MSLPMCQMWGQTRAERERLVTLKKARKKVITQREVRQWTIRADRRSIRR